MLRKYKISIAVDNRTIDIQDQVDTNYLEGEAAQMANLFYRCMLANGYSPAVASDAMGKVASANGFILQASLDAGDQSQLDFEEKR